MTWISVTESIPLTTGRVLVFNSNGSHDMDFIQFAREFRGGFIDENNRELIVTHWMEIPKPPHFLGDE